MTQLKPTIGNWYEDGRSGAVFEIVALDTDEGTVQVQYLDGEITDFDRESWSELVLLPAAEPEDWRSAFELDNELSLDADAALHPTAWANPLSSVEPEAMLGVEDL